METSPDTSVGIAGLKFKNPIVVASSECAANFRLLKNWTNRKIGAIVTKTFTSPAEFRIRVRPYQFPLNKFGKAYRQGGCLYSLAAPHVEDSETVKIQVAQMAEHCRASSVILIASFFEDPQNDDLWIRQAKSFERAGADMLELNFSSPSAAKVFSQSFDSAGHIISQVKKNTSIPIGLKLSPTLEPLELFIQACADAGLDFVTAHNAPSGIVVDVENEVPFGAPALGGYVMGRVFLPYSLGRIVRIRKIVDIPIIGVGGIYEAQDALQYILCGCPLIGIGSALYFKGPRILDEIHNGITDWMQQKGYGTLSEFQGKAFTHIKDAASLKSREKHPYTTPPDCPYIPIIDDELCNRCGICETTCIYNVFSVDKNKSMVLVHEDKCWSCGFCVGICPAGAIELRDRKSKQKLIWNNQGLAQSF
ncbi:MAG: 4Fe-4S binding protein [Desulfobacterales bacterium]|nr:MAG: 4Fe-4S binding protein [Desulfobacterales bacterium]